jgi:ABC-type branched-subunit amino acid transport system substrate-binding protein
VLTVRSGPAKPIGDDILAGIETASKMYGPVLGRQVELVVEDSQFNPQQAVTKATKLVQQSQVSAILGTSTIETLALLSVADRLGVPIITSNSGSAAMVKGVKDLQYVGETFAPLDTTDWAPFIAQARAAGATAVIMPVTLGTPLLQFIQQANEFGLTKDAVLVSPIGLPDWVVDKLGATSTHVVSAGSWAAWRYEESEPATKAFNEAFYKMHGRVSGMQALQSASASLMLFNAMAKAGSADPAAVVRALETIEVSTPVGKLKFQPGGRQALVPLFLGPYEKLASPRYGASYGQRADALPASKSLPKSAAEYGCKLK